jgi:putative addiction module component (TIGR02574 family)
MDLTASEVRRHAAASPTAFPQQPRAKPSQRARLGTVTAHELLRAALKLPPEARAALAADLIESLDGKEPPEEIEAAWALEIRRRCAELDSGAVHPVPWEEARRRILAAATRGAAR